MANFDSDLYVAAPSLQQSFLDKTTGEALAGGKIYFYEDTAHGTAKEVFYLSGISPNYTVTAFPQPMVLSNIGTIIDPSGDPKIPYFNPYAADGAPLNYYIEVYDSSDVFQFSIDNFPGIGQGTSDTTEAEQNYVGNGQFLLHNDILDDGTNGAGYITDPDTDIAPGGHHFVHDGTAGQQFVTFTRDASVTSTKADYPRYEARFQQSGTGLDGTRKDYTFRFKNANTFASDSQAYTLIFNARTDTGNISVTPFIYKFFGTGGSTPDYQGLTAETITPATQKFAVDISSVGLNPGETIGPDDDDYVEIGIRFPVTSAYDVYITDVLLVRGKVPNSTYPITTKQEDSFRALAGGFLFKNASDEGVYDGSQIGLPVYLEKNGFATDDSVIGKIEALTYEPTDWSTFLGLAADGAKYEYNGQSALGIPYKRLGDKWWDTTNKVFKYGNGLNFFTAQIGTTTSDILLANNKFGAVTLATTPGTFTVKSPLVHTGVANGYYVIASHYLGSADFYMEQLVPDVSEEDGSTYINPSDTGASGFTFDLIREHPSTGTVGTPETTPFSSKFEARVTAVAESALANPSAPGKYWQFETTDGTTRTKYHVWYKVTNETDPAPATSTAILVNLEAGDTAIMVAIKTVIALRGAEGTLITCPAASAVTGSPYFEAYGANGDRYYVWLDKDGTGTDPAPGGTGIEVDIAAADTAAQVATKCQEAINKKFLAVPDLRGAFLRGWDDGKGFDPDSANRYDNYFGVDGDKVGTFQSDAVGRHGHDALVEPAGGGVNTFGADGNGPQSIDHVNASGGAESRPYNMTVQYIVRY